MADQPLPPQFVDDAPYEPPRAARPIRTPARAAAAPAVDRVPRRLTLWATLDKPLMVVVSLLLALGALMVYSATFNYGFEEFGGNDTAILMRHLINMAIGLVCTVIFTLIDYRLMRRMAVIIMLMAVSFLIAVLMFGDRTFGARRALINGRFQPGEFSELAIIIYMAAWLGSKNTRIRSLAYGFIPFTFLVGIVGVLVMLQPDLSTAAVIFGTSAVMFYLAGADMRQILIALAIAFFTGLLMLQFFPYQLERVESFLDGLTDPLQTSWQVQQALSAFYAGGWTGRGLGEGLQKFRALPAPHTDSIFAVIGEELGVLGAVIVLAMYLAFVIRGFQIARRAPDAFGSLLAGGITIWVAGKALLNIAVMTALLPPTGVPLPFISFGGSSLVVLLVGVGLLLSVHRGTVIRRNTPERKIHVASYGRSRRDGRRRISSPGRSRSDVRALS